MADIKRYDMDVGGDPIEFKEGDWVKHEDILPAIQRAYKEGLHQARAELRLQKAYPWPGSNERKS